VQFLTDFAHTRQLLPNRDIKRHQRLFPKIRPINGPREPMTPDDPKRAAIGDRF